MFEIGDVGQYANDSGRTAVRISEPADVPDDMALSAAPILHNSLGDGCPAGGKNVTILKLRQDRRLGPQHILRPFADPFFTPHGKEQLPGAVETQICAFCPPIENRRGHDLQKLLGKM